MKAKITDLEVNDYNFTGVAFILNMELKVSGDFSIEFTGQYPSVYGLDVCINGCWTTDKEASLLIDMDDLVSQLLATDNGQWYDDYLACEAEKSNDLSEDR